MKRSVEEDPNDNEFASSGTPEKASKSLGSGRSGATKPIDRRSHDHPIEEAEAQAQRGNRATFQRLTRRAHWPSSHRRKDAAYDTVSRSMGFVMLDFPDPT